MESTLEILGRLERVLRKYLTGLPAAERQRFEHDVMGLVHMARASLPRELAEASRHLQQAEATLTVAREEARRTIEDAQQRARTLGAAPAAGRSRAPVEDAQREADRIRLEAERVRRGADDYAAAVLERLATEVDRVLTTIRNGQVVLRDVGERGRPGPPR